MIIKDLESLEREAQAVMNPGPFAYVAGGAGGEAGIARNRAAWSRALLNPRLMQPMAGFSTATHVAGLDLEFPCFVAPMAFQRLADSEGEAAMARAAAAQGAGFVLSCQSSVAVEKAVVEPFWFQLFLQPTKDATFDLAARALAAGAEALVVTLDAPLSGVRPREIAAGFQLPPDVRAVMMEGLPKAKVAPDQDPVAALLAQAASWEDLEDLCDESPVPVIAKGVMSVQAAERALAAGCGGLIVSNHGGRMLEALPATADVLPMIRTAIGAEVPVLVDGGIRSGEDLFRALALGADAVLLGRPLFYALAVGGAAGASACLRRLRDEFAVTMGLMGCRTPAEITEDCLIF